MRTETAPAKHIRLTSHPARAPSGALPIHWGAADPRERGPVVGTTDQPQPAQRDRHAHRLATASTARSRSPPAR